RLIGKWLNAGVMEGAGVSYPQKGTPQGGVISPLLSNVFLHAVLDEWFEREVKPHMKGPCYMIRFADDFVMGFSHESDALRVMEVLPKRFGKYGLTLHPDKTRLIAFGPPGDDQDDGPGKPGTFDFLGFTHYWGRSRHGRWIVKRKTAASRLKRALQRVGEWCRRHRDAPL